MEQLAKNAGFNLDLYSVNKDTMIQASIQGTKGNAKGFEIIIKNNIISKQKDLFPLRSKKGLER
jgi:fido (protein-threonine AMPylation protein)